MQDISFKDGYIDKLYDFVNRYHNTYNTIKMKPGDVKSNVYINFNKEINDKDPKLTIFLEYQNIKRFVEKFTSQIGVKKILWLKELKTLCCGHIL